MKAYRVELSPTAEVVYRQIYRGAARHLNDSSHSNVKLLRSVDECLDKIIPHDPFSRKRALAGSLSNIFRVKKGRLRICYIGSSTNFKIKVLYISETLRKSGSKNDPYVLFTSMVMSGEFEQFFEELGVKRPARKSERQHLHIQ